MQQLFEDIFPILFFIYQVQSIAGCHHVAPLAYTNKINPIYQAFFGGHSELNFKSAIEESGINSPFERDYDLSQLLGDYFCHLLERQVGVTDFLIQVCILCLNYMD